jgi:hypothetical protein
MRLRIQQSKRRSPRVTHKNDFVLTKSSPKMIDDLIEIADVLRNGQILWVRFRIERSAGTTLIPVSDKKMFFKFTVEVAEQRPLRTTRSAMKPQQDGAA